jgi:hypothetical protein
MKTDARPHPAAASREMFANCLKSGTRFVSPSLTSRDKHLLYYFSRRVHLLLRSAAGSLALLGELLS